MSIFFMVLAIIAIGALTTLSKITKNPQQSKLFKLGRIPAVGLLVISFLAGMFFYAQPGYTYHVRTIWGQEIAQSGIGFKVQGFGYVNAWKNAMSVQALDSERRSMSAEGESTGLSATLPSVNVVFLDQVDAQVSATVRFVMPTEEEEFLKMARFFRSPANLLRTELIPAFEETIDANAQNIAAEEYFSGGLTSFNNDFLDQMKNGTYIVDRKERIRNASANQQASQNAALEDEQANFGDGQQVEAYVERRLDDNGLPLRKVQAFTDWGITAKSARITDVNPNEKFQLRMELKQQASADRSIAREQRIQEEEQEQLEVARGKREAAQAQAAALVIQVKATTEAETEKQLAITAAEKVRDSEALLLEASAIQLDRANIDAKAVKVAAEAEAYAKKAVINADGALDKKLDAMVIMNEAWAKASASRPVPSMVIGGAEGDPTLTGNVASQNAMITTLLAKQLNVDTTVKR